MRVLVLDRAWRLLLAKRRDPVEGGLYWEPPGGAIEPGELLEETGIDAHLPEQPGSSFRRTYRWKGEDRVRNELVFAVCLQASGAEPVMEDDEERKTFLKWRWVTEHELSGLEAELYPPDPFAIARSALD